MRALIVLLLVVGYSTPLVISPIKNDTEKGSVLFSIEKTDKILIDDNEDFLSPKQYLLSDGLKLELEKGTYYIKSVGEGGFTYVRKITLMSNFILEFKQNGDSYEVVNAGKNSINVEIYDKTKKISEFEFVSYLDKSFGGKK